MPKNTENKYTAGEQALGYIYQPRFALYRILQLPESVVVYIEKDDDLEFIDKKGKKSLTSLKHKKTGDRISDLSIDFWKSVRIWLEQYNNNGKVNSESHFFLFTTSTVSENSFLVNFIPDTNKNTIDEILELAVTALQKSTSKEITTIKKLFEKLNEDEKTDFMSRIFIFDNAPRIDDLPKIIMDQHMRTIRRDLRKSVFQQLEGWWNEEIINILTGKRNSPIVGHEVSDKLLLFADEYKTDNLPINFRGKKPEGNIDPENDPRLFVKQLKAIKINPNRIQNAIYDYYRAFEQRASWARENILFEGEVENYEERLIEEWERYRDVIFEELNDQSAEDILIKAGKELYKWAELNTDHLRIRSRVSEPYVVRGNFHILANYQPTPKVYWYPYFLKQIENILEGSVNEKME